MRKLLISVLALALMLALPLNMKAETRVFGGFNYVGNWGAIFGVEQSISGKITLTPFGRYSIDSTITDGVRFKRSAGIETMAWLYSPGQWRFGLTASPLTVDWIDKPDENIGVYWGGSGGFAVDWKGANLGFRGWAKVKTDFKTATSYKDLSEFGLIAVINKFW